MPQTPKSISVNVLGSGTPAATAYTVPAATTAVVKTALGVNVVGGSSTFTLQKQSGGFNYPLILAQTPTITPATGGTAFNSRNLLDGPVTLAAGESILVSDTASPSFRFPQTSNTFTTFTSTQLVARTQAFANGIYVQVGSDGSNSTSFVVRSTDAVTWTQIATGNALGVSGGAYYMANVGNTWVVGAWNNTSYMYSTDNALTWTAASLPTNANIYSLAANGTTFVFGTGIGLYTSTNGSTWTLNTAYNTYIGTTPANDQYTPQGVTWNGTNFFISNYEGTVFTSDLSTYTALYCFNGGAYRTNAFWGVTWSSAYSRYYTLNWRSTGADVIISSTNGFTWSATATGTNIFSGSQIGRVASAGSNTILIAKTGMGGTQYLKSTNGTTWSSTSDVRGFAGIIRGLDNGFFFVGEQQGASGRAYLTTDPSVSSGTLMTSSSGSAAQWRDAASDGTGWVAVYNNVSTNIQYAAYGTNGTTVSNANVVIDSTGSYGNISGIVWWAAASVYIAWTDQGYIFASTAGLVWTLLNIYSSQLSAGNVRMVPVGNRLYATSSNNTSGGGGFIYTTTTTYATATNWIFTAISTNMYSNGNQGYFLNNAAQYSTSAANAAGALATNGTDILYSNGYGGISVFTPSVSGSSFRTPGTGGLSVERVNGLDIVYTGRTYSGNGTYGAYYGSNIATTLPTAQFSTSSGNALSFNYTQTPSSVVNSFGAFSFLNSNYYAVPLGGSGNTISYGTDLRLLTNRTWGSTAIGGVNTVTWSTSNNSNNPFVSNGTSLTTFQNSGNNQIRAWSGDPASALAASVITLSVVEVS